MNVAGKETIEKFIKTIKTIKNFKKIKTMEEFEEVFWQIFKQKCQKCRRWLFLNKFSLKATDNQPYKLCDSCRKVARELVKKYYIPKKERENSDDSSEDCSTEDSECSDTDCSTESDN